MGATQSRQMREREIALAANSPGFGPGGRACPTTIVAFMRVIRVIRVIRPVARITATSMPNRENPIALAANQPASGLGERASHYRNRSCALGTLLCI